ncbi:unnamed protein product [Lampetra planeri]
MGRAKEPGSEAHDQHARWWGNLENSLDLLGAGEEGVGRVLSLGGVERTRVGLGGGGNLGFWEPSESWESREKVGGAKRAERGRASFGDGLLFRFRPPGQHTGRFVPDTAALIQLRLQMLITTATPRMELQGCAFMTPTEPRRKRLHFRKDVSQTATTTVTRSCTARSRLVNTSQQLPQQQLPQQQLPQQQLPQQQLPQQQLPQLLQQLQQQQQLQQLQQQSQQLQQLQQQL